LRWISPAAYKDIYRGETLKRSVPGGGGGGGPPPAPPQASLGRGKASWPRCAPAQASRRRASASLANLAAFFRIWITNSTHISDVWPCRLLRIMTKRQSSSLRIRTTSQQPRCVCRAIRLSLTTLNVVF
jgi:hypothetical protein